MKKLLILLLSFTLIGCSSKNVSTSSIQSISSLTTLESFYHNVAEYEDTGNKYLNYFFPITSKKLWIEYEGTVKIGINDFSQVTLKEEDNTVTVTLPHTEVLDTSVNEENYKIYSKTGILATITDKNEQEALSLAQETMEKQATEDQSLIKQADLYAKDVIESFILKQDKNYTVKFKYLKS